MNWSSPKGFSLTEARGLEVRLISLDERVRLVAIVVVPLSVEILERVFGLPFAMAPDAIAKVVLVMALQPLAAGMVLRAVLPKIADRIEKPVSLVAKVLLPLAVLALLAGTWQAVWAAVGDGTVIAMVVFIAADSLSVISWAGRIRIIRLCSRSRALAGILASPSRSPQRTSRTSASAAPSCSI